MCVESRRSLCLLIVVHALAWCPPSTQPWRVADQREGFFLNPDELAVLISKTNASDWPSLHRLGMSLLATPGANLSHAIESLEHAIALARRDVASAATLAELHYSLGNALCTSGRADSAVGHLRRAIALKPTPDNAFEFTAQQSDFFCAPMPLLFPLAAVVEEFSRPCFQARHISRRVYLVALADGSVSRLRQKSGNTALRERLVLERLGPRPFLPRLVAPLHATSRSALRRFGVHPPPPHEVPPPFGWSAYHHY